MERSSVLTAASTLPGTATATATALATASGNNDATTQTGTHLSQARQSLRSVLSIDRPEYKGDKKNPSYAIDSDVELNANAVDRSDDDLSILDLGKKYMDTFKEIEFVIADLTGNMVEDFHDPLKLFPGVKEAFDLLKQHGIRVILVTNSWRSSKNRILELLNSAGITVELDDIFTSSDACKMYLKENKLGRPYYLVHENVLQDFSEYPRKPKEDVVIVGLPSTQFDYRLLSKGMDLLIRRTPMIALNMMKKDPSPNVYNISLGAGPFVNMLEVCTDSEPVQVCKPYSKYYEYLCRKMGCPDHSKIVVIGDDILEDIAGAKAMKMKTILTRTGIYQANDEKTECAELAPDATAENFVMAVRLILSSKAVGSMSEDDFVEEERSSRGCMGSAETASMRDDYLTKKVEAYINTEPKSKRELVEKLVKMPSYIW